MNVEPTNDPTVLEEWVGRTIKLRDPMHRSGFNILAATLADVTDAGRDGLNKGSAIPPLWHFAAFNEAEPAHNLGRDGHPKRGGFLPPVALPRRMWAGSRITFDHPLYVDEEAMKTSTIKSVVFKVGSTGPLCFVTVEHVITNAMGTVCITEEQDLVYREDPDPDAPVREPKPAPTDADGSRTVTPETTLLFRYSAVTLNAHRIHYDRDYAMNVEGYDGLVFHGPLTATLLADMAVQPGYKLATFSFRGVSPLLDTAPFTIHRKATETGADLWAANPTGGLAMTAEATYQPYNP